MAGSLRRDIVGLLVAHYARPHTEILTVPAQHILTRRLERLSAALRNASETRSITTLTFDHGFASESHCSRAFRGTFGLPPGRYRAEMRHPRADGRSEPPPGGSAASLMSAWSRDLA
ncbi:helix-turn-helix domain-containing protein [Methylorubrum populi]|uniref:helix-turn-helix domain-containing protein n=1 Tax=Methylorubrum populi TaxID=223967 RepID=UPI002452E318|nr:helix-turn-helix domain-containing protein [Methylorubrum populi]